MVVASFAEIVSLGAVLPFLGVLSAPEEMYQNPYMQPINDFFNVSEPSQLLLPLTAIFIGAAIFAGLIRVALLYFTTRLSYATGADLGVDIYRRTLYKKYEETTARHR